MESNNKDYIIIDAKTGETLDCIKGFDPRISNTIKKRCVDKMLSEATTVRELDRDLLLSWCRVSGEMNEFYQIKCHGTYMNKQFLESASEDIVVAGYVVRLLLATHPYSSILVNSSGLPLRSWAEVWSAIGCSTNKTQKLKAFIKSKKLLRETSRVDLKTGETYKCFVVNPFLVRNSTYINTSSAALFADFFKDGSNISTYVVRFLQATGEIDY